MQERDSSFLQPKSLRYALFDKSFLKENLDYTDSNGERYSQILSDNDFHDGESPLLRSQLTYEPSNSDTSGTFIGQVEGCLPDTLKTWKVRPMTIRKKLHKYLTDAIICDDLSMEVIGEFLEVYVEGMDDVGCIFVDINKQEGTLTATLSFPSALSESEDTRYYDTALASELWLMLHDFIINIEEALGANKDLGQAAYNAYAVQTLDIGRDPVPELDRLGQRLLFFLNVMESAAPKLGKIDYTTINKKVQNFSDEEVDSVIKCALRMVADNGVLTDDLFQHAIDLVHA